MSRKSDVALPTIMNVFLMIAVILVASSFLLKAFGIDIWEFLNNLFGKLFIQEGKVLYVKTDPDQNQIFQFRVITPKLPFLVDDEAAGFEFKSYFYLEKFPDNQCTLFVVDENGGVLGDKRDEGFIYYLPSGTVIQEGCGNNLKECVSKYKFEGGCKFGEAIDSKEPCDTQCRSCSQKIGNPLGGDMCIGQETFSCKGKLSYVDCDPKGLFDNKCSPNDINKQKVMTRNFGTLRGEEDCKDGKEYCKILDPDTYEIKYGLVCDQDGKWYPCTENTDKTTERGQRLSGPTYTCNGAGEWIIKKPSPLTTLTLSTNKEVYLPLDTEIQLKATTSTSPTGELFNIEVVPPSTKPKCTIFQGFDSCEILYNLPTVSGPIEFKATAYKSGAAFIIGEKIAETSKKVDVDLWTEGTVSWTGKNVKISLSDDKKVGDASIRGSITSSGEISMTYQFIQPISISSTQSIKFYTKANSDSNGRIYITDENKKTYYAEYEITGYAELKIGEDFSLIELKQSDFQLTGFIGGIDWNRIKSIEFTANGQGLMTMLVDYLHIYPPPEPTFKLAKDSSLPTMPTSEEES